MSLRFRLFLLSFLAASTAGCEPSSSAPVALGDGGTLDAEIAPSDFDPEPEPLLEPDEAESFSVRGLPLDAVGHPAEAEIRAMYEAEGLRGFPDGTFRPDYTLTRSSYAAVVAALDRQRLITAGATRCPTARFSDVPSDYWAASAIARAAELGFLCGFPDGTFRPRESLTREQLLVSIVAGLRLRTTSRGNLSRFEDAREVSSWARERVEVASTVGLLANSALLAHGGGERRLRPRETATRAEAASFLARGLGLPLRREAARVCLPTEGCSGTDVCLTAVPTAERGICVAARQLFDDAVALLLDATDPRLYPPTPRRGTVTQALIGGGGSPVRSYFFVDVVMGSGRYATVLYDGAGQLFSDEDTRGIVRLGAPGTDYEGAWILRGRVLVARADGQPMRESTLRATVDRLPRDLRALVVGIEVDPSGAFAIVRTRHFDELEVATALSPSGEWLAEPELFRLGGFEPRTRIVQRF